jgi:hypothetical protein
MAPEPAPSPGKQRDGTFVGQSPKDVTSAIKAAYEVARKDKEYSTGTLSFHVDDIWVTGTNPISEYVVKLRPPEG